MGIIRVSKKENPYAQIDKRLLNDTRLTWRAKGILCYLLSKPDDWTIQVADIWKHGVEGRKAVQDTLAELEKIGYAELKSVRGKGGVLLGKEWVITEEPKIGLSVAADEPKTDEPINRRLVSRRITKNELNTKNEGSKGENENSPTPAEKPTPLEAKKEKAPLIPVAPPKDDQATSAKPLPLTADCRPNSKTPVDLFAKLQQFYIDNPLEWKDGVLQMAKGSKYSEAQRREIVTDFCCYTIKNNHGGDTYQMLSARSWLRNHCCKAAFSIW